MKETKTEFLAWSLRQAKKNKKPQPVFFLGAGASHSGNIPTEDEIIKHIVEDKEYKEWPSVKTLTAKLRTYAELMGCLPPKVKDKLLKEFIDKAKINVTHIYLAQLMKEGFVDYILTVNSDNLILRALALHDLLPATYDMANLNLKDLTTAKFEEKSVINLHEPPHGLSLHNPSEETDKVKAIVSKIFDAIKDRPWVFIGYTGKEPVFEHIKNPGKFDNRLYWVSCKDDNPDKEVQRFLLAQRFLSAPDTNAFIIKAYDCDSFMLELTRELGLGQHVMIDKPFTSAHEILTEIVDSDDKDHFREVTERLEMAKRSVAEAIPIDEPGKVEVKKNLKDNTGIDLLKKEILNLLITGNYQEKVISAIEERAGKLPDDSLQSLLSNLYLDQGISLADLAMTKSGKEAEKFYRQSLKKFQKAVEIKPNYYDAYSRWGFSLAGLARAKEGIDSEKFFRQSIVKYQKAIEINPDRHEAYNNRSISLGELATTKEGKQADELYHQALKDCQKAVEIKPDLYQAYNDWGITLGELASTKKGKEKEDLYYQSFEKFQKALEINPDCYAAYNSWGICLAGLTWTKEGKEEEDLYHQSFEKFQKALEINPDCHEACINWGNYLGNLAGTKEGEEKEDLYRQSFEKFQKALEIKPDFRDACSCWCTKLGRLRIAAVGKKAKDFYRRSLKKYEKFCDCQREEDD